MIDHPHFDAKTRFETEVPERTRAGGWYSHIYKITGNKTNIFCIFI